MFFCEPCRKERNWPESLALSRGTCEMCDTYAYCHDVHSARLPSRRVLTEGEVIAGVELF